MILGARNWAASTFGLVPKTFESDGSLYSDRTDPPIRHLRQPIPNTSWTPRIGAQSLLWQAASSSPIQPLSPCPWSAWLCPNRGPTRSASQSGQTKVNHEHPVTTAPVTLDDKVVGPNVSIEDAVVADHQRQLLALSRNRRH